MPQYRIKVNGVTSSGEPRNLDFLIKRFSLIAAHQYMLDTLRRVGIKHVKHTIEEAEEDEIAEKNSKDKDNYKERPVAVAPTVNNVIPYVHKAQQTQYGHSTVYTPPQLWYQNRTYLYKEYVSNSTAAKTEWPKHA